MSVLPKTLIKQPLSQSNEFPKSHLLLNYAHVQSKTTRKKMSFGIVHQSKTQHKEKEK